MAIDGLANAGDNGLPYGDGGGFLPDNDGIGVGGGLLDDDPVKIWRC
jgi:hypothetical protein